MNDVHVNIDLKTTTKMIDGETYYVTNIQSKQFGSVSATHARSTRLSIALALDSMSRHVKQWGLSNEPETWTMLSESATAVLHSADGKPRNCT